MAQYPQSSLDFIFNHVILPPRLPQEAEDPQTLRNAEQDLLRLVLSEAEQYCHYRVQSAGDSVELRGVWKVIRTMLSQCLTLISSQPMTQDALCASLDNMETSGKLPCALLIRIQSQNAMMIVRKTEANVVFECFEASPSAGAVTTCEGNLLRTFPARAVAVPITTFNDLSFRSELAATFSKADWQVVAEMMPKAQKAGSTLVETRDTANPAIVSDLFMTILAALGHSVPVQQIQKRTRDDALWKNAKLPWRRSPLWLGIRVAIQTTLCNALPGEAGMNEYKNFMIFLITKFASLALATKQPGDLCQVILAKIGRRTYKLGPNITNFVQGASLTACQSVRAELDKRWDAVQAADANRVTSVPMSSFSQHTALSLTESRRYLDAALASGEDPAPATTSFTPRCDAWIRWHQGLPIFRDANYSKEELILVLSEIETWVSESLPAWVAKFDTSTPSADDCTAVTNLAKSYWNKARSAYAGFPEQSSCMLLLIAELWYAVDRMVTKLIPLMNEYSPAIDSNMFHALLLPKNEQMQRLHIVERYLKERHTQAKQGNPSIFSNPTSSSFSVQYFSSSATHKALRKRIEGQATSKKAEKEAEWQEASRSHKRMIAEAEALHCEYYTDEWDCKQHDYDCEKCALNKSARSLTITKYEWPLPENESSCRTAVFELDCPDSFVAWRNITWMLLHDIGRSERVRGRKPTETLSRYSGLRSFAKDKKSRMTLASIAKSMMRAHYTVHFPVGFDACYSNNALRYELLDSEGSWWVEEQTEPASLKDFCTMQLPVGPYYRLQYAVNSTDHAQNQVIADQDSCPPDLSLHEFISFGSLRADGERTQWLNIRRELAASNLNFNTEAVCTLVLHSAWQAGSKGETAARVSHLDLTAPAFCHEMLTTIKRSVDAVEANWKSDFALFLLITLALRVLSLTEDHHVIDSTLDLLMRMRLIVRRWTVDLSKLLNNATEQIHVNNFQYRLLKAAMLCKLTYDVDVTYRLRVMDGSSDLSLWIVCSILIRENLPGDSTLLPGHIRRMYLHDMKLTHALHKDVLDLVTVRKNDGLNQAISQVWSGFHSTSESWKACADPNGRWLSKETQASAGRTSQCVFYNVLSGELLVDGRPVGKLPREYLESGVYVRIFGAQILKVFSSDILGMVFMSSQRYYGHIVYFAMRDQRVVIRISWGSQIMELIPHTVLMGDLPLTFVADYAHWLDLSSRDIEFRPMHQRWTFDFKNWRMHYRPGATSTLRQDGRCLIDIRSKTCAAIMHVFGSLETCENVHITCAKDEALRVALPRMDLCFSLNQTGHFQCHELCKIVDPDQSLGTMIGLTNRLILCGLGEHAQRHDRLVLIPFGKVSVSASGHHTKVMISTNGQKIRLYRYHIDSILGRLQSNGDVVSHLYKFYLHALTTHIIPDLLTGSTGTEEALTSLRLRSMCLSAPANQDVTRLLKDIASLTPGRLHYPPHLEVMQQVTWHPTLSTLAQHDEFLPLAQHILHSGDKYLMFDAGSKAAPSLYSGRDLELLARARFRNASHRSQDLGGDISKETSDVCYTARDCIPTSEQAGRALEIAKLVRDWPQQLTVSKRFLSDIIPLKTMVGFGAPFDTSEGLVALLSLKFPESLAALLERCRRSSQEKDRYKLMFTFSTIAYGGKITSTTMLRTLLAFAFVPELRNMGNPPPHPLFTLTIGSDMDQSKVRAIIRKHMKSFTPSSSRTSPAEFQEQRDGYEKEKVSQIELALSHYTEQWPCRKPQSVWAECASLLGVKAANQEIINLYTHWTNNGELTEYINRAQAILDRVYESPRSTESATVSWQVGEVLLNAIESTSLPTVTMLMSAPPRLLGSQPTILKAESLSQASKPNAQLRALVSSRFNKGKPSSSSVRSQYSDDLMASIEAFNNHVERVTPLSLPFPLSAIASNHQQSRDHVHGVLRQFQKHFSSHDAISQILDIAGLGPRLTIRTFLGLMSGRSFYNIPQAWRDCLLAVGEATTILQRARRLVLAAECGDISSVSAELENIGRTGWEAKTWPEWLLIEIENDLLIRPNQAQVALEMLKPFSQSNSLTQLNMGEGKSSVIVPLVAAAIADGKRLSRVIVLKSLAKQMGDTLSVRLGGLVDRPVYHMPFTRKVALTPANVSQIQALQEACMSNKGILLAQPEHILSFKLIGIEQLTAGKFQMASPLLKAQQWLEMNARDLLDESDEILDVKFQLIYTLGTQRLMDGQPDRWLITQSVFDLVEKHAETLHASHPKLVEVSHRSKPSFPSIRLLSEEIGQTLMSKVAHDILKSYLPGLNFEQCSKLVTEAVLRFIQYPQVSKDDCDLLKRSFGAQESSLQKLLLVRGLIAYNIMLFVLRSKRFSVNYGLHPSRCLSAVPYRAKGVPSPSAEFGHPDVAIALTCLTYYYTGLSEDQVRQCFEILQKLDDPSLEYGTWVAGCSKLPNPLRDWNAVNLEDSRQFADNLFPALRYGKKIADFFMANVVFPREGKEFDEKLSTSGWDIPSIPGRGHLTTGFSGTNDNRFLLPLSITQQDLPNLQHTSAKVLTYVLRKENLRYFLAQDKHGGQLLTKDLLWVISKAEPNVRVLIDVGAQVLDVANVELVRMWLTVVQDCDAGIFFDKDDNVMVLTRDGKIETLAASSFQARMDRCLVYLDEVHTRGTDLKLPINARAAVTLGPRLPKDKLVQACMRLRKLAQGQSLFFVAPPEVHHSIISTTGKDEAKVDGYDVVAWSLEQSCLSIERAQPLRVLQGLSHHRRQATMTAFTKTLENLDRLGNEITASNPLVLAFREKEKQQLIDLYAPQDLKDSTSPGVIESFEHDQHLTVKKLIAIWKDIDFSASEGATMHEEHEREVAQEVEQERQIQRPPHVNAFQRSVDRSLRKFVRAALPEDLDNFLPAFQLVGGSSARCYSVAQKPFQYLWVTKDFATTVKHSPSGFNDNFLRPVNWILTAKGQVKPFILLVISQYEANQLWDEIHAASSAVRLHVYEPRVTKSMISVDSPLADPSATVISWQSLTSRSRQILGSFAGQLYFNTYQDYREYRELLAKQPIADMEKTLSFLKAWIAIRRKGQDFLPSHIGQMVSNRTIQEEAFD